MQSRLSGIIVDRFLMRKTNRKRPASSSADGASPRDSSARFIDPMLLLRTDSLPDSDQWIYELKLDGYRAIAFKRNGTVHCGHGTTMTSASGTQESSRHSRGCQTTP